MSIRLFNSLTRMVEDFKPIESNKVKIYTCGPTVYHDAHVGNMRAYVFSDILRRMFETNGYEVQHVINITDVGHLTDDADAGEDKLEKRSVEINKSIYDIAEHYTKSFLTDINHLNIKSPTRWTRATEYVDKMIDFAKSIQDNCYEIDSGLYFDTSTVPDHGYLSRNTNGEHSSRIENSNKKNPKDFAIWRKTSDNVKRQMEWDSPWGRGAPGWHLECSVMSYDTLGFPFDIHTGGIDHREIHHPNEIAQNQAFCHSNNSGANYWIHVNFLLDKSGKMSKSNGDFLTLQSLIEYGYHPLSYRLMLLQSHYQNEVIFDWETLQSNQTRLKRWVKRISELKIFGKLVELNESSKHMLADSIKSISDNLNTSKILGTIDKFLDDKSLDSSQLLSIIFEFDRMLGMNLYYLTREQLRVRPINSTISEIEISNILEQRIELKRNKNYQESDRLRDYLISNRISVLDGDSLQWDYIPVID